MFRYLYNLKILIELNCKVFIIYIVLLISSKTYSQTDSLLIRKEHEHDQHYNELGIANSPVYFLRENIFSYGLHFHWVRNILKSKFGLGLGYERIFDKHSHHTFGIIGSYQPIDRMNIIFSPGISFENGNNNGKFALHLESTYEWQFHQFHYGPSFEIAYDPEDYHISIGIHFGYGL